MVRDHAFSAILRSGGLSVVFSGCVDLSVV
jgi:hypothetical protein